MPQEPKSYFLQSPHGGNTLQPVKTKSDIRIPKPPKAPEKPLMPYMRYSRKVWEQVKNSNPHLKLWEVGKIIGQMWRELPDDEKALYVEEYDAEKTQYTELLRQYHSSPAYQAWLVAKERAEKSMEEQDQERKQASARARERAGELAQSDLRESYILEDNEEDTEDQYTAKHVAAARFHRNHRLMQDILSDARLPDPGQLITQGRLNTLRLQVEQLKNHKRNLCQEIESCEARHRAKIQRIRDDSERFRLDYQKVTSNKPVITESQFADMIVKTRQDMLREEEERRSRFQAELEIRRRRQQQRQLEAEAESERRRQLLHQQQLQQAAAAARASHPNQHDGNAPFSDRPLERLIMQDKREEAAQPPTKLNNISPQVSASGKLPSTPVDIGSQEANLPYSGASSLPPSVPSPTGHKVSQASHTQHHYPPPPNYPPTALSPASVPVAQHQRSQAPLIPQVPPINAAKPSPSSLGRTKKVPSSASSTSSGSSASSTSSKKKKSDVTEPPKEKTNELAVANNSNQETRERHISGSADFVQEQSKTEYPVASAQVSDFHPSMQQRQMVNSQLYQQPPSQAGPPPNATVSSHNLGPVPSTPYAYDQGMPNVPISSAPTSGYYQPSVPMSHTNPHSTYPPHTRPPFSQHPGYNVMQYAPMPQQGHSSEHPPPMYIQHMPQQPHVPQNGPPMVGGSQHPPGHLPPQSQQNPAGGWHQTGPAGYATHYGPSRYPTPNPVGYPPQAMRHFASNPGYPVPHHPGMQHGAQQHPHHQIPPPVSLQENTGSSQIPAPPPYQQQQQQPGSPMGYWASPHQVPPEYVSGQTPHPYMSGPQSEQMNVPTQQTPASMEGIHSASTISASTPNEASMVPMTPQQAQNTNMYYSGGPPPSYGHPGGMNASGFYPMPHHYPAPHPSNVHGPWSGYPPSVGPPHPPAYQSPQPHQHHQQQSCVPTGAFPNSQLQPPKSDQIGSSVAGMDNTQGIPPISNPSSSPVSSNN